jgi:protoheme IX farnesyltransferase
VLVTQVARTPLAVAADVIALTKPRLSSLVVATTGVGVLVAPGHISFARGVAVVLVTALLVAAANAINSYMERDIDARMPRTSLRPLPAGRLDPRGALAGGILGAAVLVPILAEVANPLTALLGAIAYVTYVALYTPLKQVSSWALVVGAIPGALPPAMGATAVTGHLDATALVLFGILFVWQLPHFVAISMYLRDEYTMGGLKVFAVVHGNRVSALVITISTFALLPVSLLAVRAGMGGAAYLVVAGVLGAAFFALAASFPMVASADRWARWVFRASLLYLVFLLAALSAAAG